MKNEDKSNVLLTCKEHSLETYLKIKKTEKLHKGFVYCQIKAEGKVENVWVKITKGNRRKGRGFISNQPFLLKTFKFGDYIPFKTIDKIGYDLEFNSFKYKLTFSAPLI